MSNATDPAFPVEGRMYGEILGGQLFHGMTKRELFAAMATQGFCANSDLTGWTNAKAAKMAVEQADALIYELEHN